MLCCIHTTMHPVYEPVRCLNIWGWGCLKIRGGYQTRGWGGIWLTTLSLGKGYWLTTLSLGKGYWLTTLSLGKGYWLTTLMRNDIQQIVDYEPPRGPLGKKRKSSGGRRGILHFTQTLSRLRGRVDPYPRAISWPAVPPAALATALS